ncbi:hypothetical protein ANN_03317 [Periplaneta americana]|uniref:FP protein C-terminal domain-containing protein n=1 Tax=Periplaneta americana TaxID=6978 RepID=A0ABQ8TYM5_PERAM|nr:hypothetical protein ANN_03317 [Periplaneta americana]
MTPASKVTQHLLLTGRGKTPETTSTTRCSRDAWLQCYKVESKKKGDGPGIPLQRLPNHAGLGRFTAADHLTVATRDLLRKTRDIAKMKGYKFVWTKDCNIFIRENESSSVVSRRNSRRRRFSAEDVSQIKLTNRFNVLETMEVDQPSLNPPQQASAEDDEDLVKLYSGFTKRDHIVIVGGPGNSLDRDVSYSVEKDLENISKDSSHTNVEVAELFDRPNASHIGVIEARRIFRI